MSLEFYGCSSEIHYSVARLGLREGVAGECRRVARDLIGLPDLTLAAEHGTIEMRWGRGEWSVFEHRR